MAAAGGTGCDHPEGAGWRAVPPGGRRAAGRHGAPKRGERPGASGPRYPVSRPAAHPPGRARPGGVRPGFGAAHETVQALISALQDADAAVRRDAAFALGQMGAAEAVTRGHGGVRREVDARARRRMIEALGKIRTPGERRRRSCAGGAGELESPGFWPWRFWAPWGASPRSAPGGCCWRSWMIWIVRTRRSAARTTSGGSGPPSPGRQRGAGAPGAGRIRQGRPRGDVPRAGARASGRSLRRSTPAGVGRLGRRLADPRECDGRAGCGARGSEDPGGPGQGLDDASIHVAVVAAQAMAGRRSTPEEIHRTEAWIGDHPGCGRCRRPARLGRPERGRAYVLGWIDRVPPEDTVRRRVGLRALAVLPGRRGPSPSGGGRGPARDSPGEAVAALARRWREERGDTGAPPRDVLSPVQPRAPERGRARGVHRGPRLADSAFTTLGSVDTLAAAWAG